VSGFVLATANPDKGREIFEILGDWIELRPRPPEVPDVDETGDSLIENARLKAQAIVLATGAAAIADDTGLEVDALGGAPGVYSARYAGEHASYRENVAKLLAQLAGVGEPRLARFRTVALALLPDGTELVAEGVVGGSIALEPLGERGFGYDPVFIPTEGDGRTFAQMEAEEKHRLSHRGAAFRLLRELLTGDAARRGR
jgi:XTP/dITP diphosphohydrolase